MDHRTLSFFFFLFFLFFFSFPFSFLIARARPQNVPSHRDHRLPYFPRRRVRARLCDRQRAKQRDPGPPVRVPDLIEPVRERDADSDDRARPDRESGAIGHARPDGVDRSSARKLEGARHPPTRRTTDGIALFTGPCGRVSKNPTESLFCTDLSIRTIGI